MYKEEITHYSECLSREMHIMVYGHDGIPFLAFPTQDSLCHNYEDFGMIGELSGYLEEGKIRYFVVDTIDKESWSEGDPDLGRRAWKQELYFRYIVDEAMPIILERTGMTAVESFHTIHNYINTGEGILRKGAIAAHAGELVLIPLNMRDGSVLARGRGNAEWNYSAPHGAGRLMSRSKARETLDLDAYRATMAGVYTTNVSSTLFGTKSMLSS